MHWSALSYASDFFASEFNSLNFQQQKNQMQNSTYTIQLKSVSNIWGPK